MKTRPPSSFSQNMAMPSVAKKETGVVVAVGAGTVDVRMPGGEIYRRVPCAGGAPAVGSSVPVTFLDGKPASAAGGASSAGTGGLVVLSSGSGGVAGVYAPSPHALNSVHHTGEITTAQASWAMPLAGGTFTGNVGASTGVTIDGVDISAHAANVNAHHNQAHAITGADHTVTGSAYQLIGLTGTNTLGLLTPASTVAANTIPIGGVGGAITWSGAQTFSALTTHNLGATIAAGQTLTTPAITATAALTVNPVGDIVMSPGSFMAKVNTNSRIQSSDYASQTTGWGIDGAGYADFRYIYVDEMHAKAFIADLEQALAGSQIITKSVAKLAADFAFPAAWQTALMQVEEFAGFTGAVFADNDIVRLRQFTRGTDGSLTIANAWGTVVYVSRVAASGTTPAYQNFKFTRSSAYPGTAQSHFAVPASDISKVNWTEYAGSGGPNAYDEMDEGIAYADDLTTAWQTDAVSETTRVIAFALSTLTDPAVSTGHTIKARIVKNATGGAELSGVIYLYEGTTLRAQSASVVVDSTWTTISYTLSAAEADSITNYGTLRLQLIATFGAGAARTCLLTAMEMELSTASYGYVEAGALALDYGATAGGYHEINAVDGPWATTNAPYSQTATWATHPGAGVTVRTRLGNLRGVTSTAEYGLYAGQGFTADNTSKYVRISDQNAELHNLPLRLYDSSVAAVTLDPATPSIAVGNPVPTAYGTGTGFWVGKDTAYKLRIGDPTGTRLAWDGTQLLLYNTSTNYMLLNGTSLAMYADSKARVSLTAAGSLTINDSGGAAVFTFNASTGAEFTKPLTLGTAGGIYQGTGTFATPTTGLKLWNDSGIGRMAGYGSGDEQWSVDTSGRLVAGTAGQVRLDRYGVSVLAGTEDYSYGCAFWFRNPVTSPEAWGVSAYEAGSTSSLDLRVENTTRSGMSSQIFLKATPYGGQTGKIVLSAGEGGDTSIEVLDSAAASTITLDCITVTATKDLAVSANAGIGTAPVATNAVTAAITGVTSTVYGVYSYGYATPSSAQTGLSAIGVNGIGILNAGYDWGVLYGGRFIADHAATAGTISATIAGYFLTRMTGASGAGVITSSRGVEVGTPTRVSSSATIGTQYGVLVRNQGAAFVTTAYGMYLENITGATNNWSIYSAGGNGYHAGSWLVGTTTAAPNAGSVRTAKGMVTPEGGWAILCTAGENLTAGQIVQVGTSTSERVVKAAAGSLAPVGAVYATATSGNPVWIVVAGFAEVTFGAGVTPYRGEYAFVNATTAGVADRTASPTAAQRQGKIGMVYKTGTEASTTTCVVNPD